MAENPMTRDDCWLCDGCGEVEAISAHGVDVTVGCPVCIQNDEQWMRGKAEAERDALAAQLEEVSGCIPCTTGADWADVVKDIEAILEVRPTTSLARRDARMRADGVRHVAGVLDESGGGEVARTLCRLADAIERQADQADTAEEAS